MKRFFLISACLAATGLLASLGGIAPGELQAQGSVTDITGGPAVALAPPEAAPSPPAQPPAEAAGQEKTAPPADEQNSISQVLAKSDAAYRRGDYIEALDALWAAEEMMWRRAPLGVRNVAFVTEQPENFGTYSPKIGEDFRSPEPLIFYCEPIGVTQLKEGDTYKYSIIGALDILDSAGQVLGGQKNLGPYEQKGYRTFSTEIMMSITIGTRGLPAGSYIMRVTLTDNLDLTKSVQLDKPFNIVE
ncbi:MAG: hypothetical protein LBP55_03990 [Candidatus Adiutrix sp.]|jgi:hypothetical protein|nr:hypothetical protein [Candidatus Adiutrix sp.]